MGNSQIHSFDCQVYVAPHGRMSYSLPSSATIAVARLEPIEYGELIDPGFRRLLAAFESLPKPLKLVQV